MRKKFMYLSSLALLLLAAIAPYGVLAKKQSNNVLEFNIGKKVFKFAEKDLSFRTNNNTVIIQVLKSSKTKIAGLAFDFTFASLRENKKFNTLSKGQRAQDNDDIGVDLIIGSRNKHKVNIMQAFDNSEAQGELTLTELNKEARKISGVFQFDINVEQIVQTKKKEKTKFKTIKITNGKFNISVDALGASFLLEDSDFFEFDERFLSDITFTSAEEEIIASYSLDNQRNITVSSNDLDVIRDGGLLIIDLDTLGVFSESKLRFVFRTKELASNTLYDVVNINRFNSFAFRDPPRPIVLIETLQSYSNLDEGILNIERKTLKNSSIEGFLTIKEFDSATGVLKANFEFKTEVEFTHEQVNGSFKGPIERVVTVKSGELNLTIPEAE